jgi:hypothetical protein
MDITNIQALFQDILEKLSKFKYLTNTQFAYLLQKNKDYVRNLGTSEMVKRDFIGVIQFGVVPKIGRLENIYFLKPKGINILEDLGYTKAEIRYPKGTGVFTKDYFHRIETINTHIGAVQFLENTGGEMLNFDTYYDKSGNNRTDGNSLVNTKLVINEDDFIIPDGIMKYNLKGNDYLYLLEVYRGKDTKRVLHQVRKLIYCIYNGIPTKKYNHSKGSRLLLIFETETAKKYALDRIKADEYLAQFNGFDRFVFGRNLENIKEQFNKNWQDLNGKTFNLLDF